MVLLFVRCLPPRPQSGEAETAQELKSRCHAAETRADALLLELSEARKECEQVRCCLSAAVLG